jgi:BirA family biotin operon repressor/biotin-[acetyl-CoA-carboxylase] ligase
MACALALADAIERHTGLTISLKWPNDLLVGGRKIAGVLAELSMAEDRLEYAVVGIGINANLDFSDPQLASLADRATSLAREGGSPVPREPLLASILQHLEAYYLALCIGWSPRQQWVSQLATLGRQVVVSGPRYRLEGRAVDVDQGGALLLRLSDGQVVQVLAGDVSLRPIDSSHQPFDI